MFLRKTYIKKRFHEFFPALTVPNYRRFLSGRVFGMFGMWVVNPIIPWIVYDITGSKAALGRITFIGQLPMVLLVIGAGVFADRHSRKNLVFLTQAGMMLASFVMGAFLARGEMTGLLAIYIYMLANGIFRALDVPSRQAFIVDLVGITRLPNAIALRSATFNSTRIIGPIFSGFLYERFGAGSCFFVKGALFVPILIALMSLRDIEPVQKSAGTRGYSDLVEGLKYAWSRPAIRTILILWAVFSIFASSFAVLQAAVAQDIYMVGAKKYALLPSARGIGAWAAATLLAVMSSRSTPRRRSLIGIGLVAIALLALSLNRSFWMAVPIVVVYGFGWVSFTVSSDILLQSIVEPKFRGRMMGLRTFVFGGMFGIGALLSGQVANIPSVGPMKTVFGSALVLCLAALLLGRQVMAIRLPDDIEDFERNSENGPPVIP